MSSNIGAYQASGMDIGAYQTSAGAPAGGGSVWSLANKGGLAGMGGLAGIGGGLAGAVAPVAVVIELLNQINAPGTIL